MATSDDQILDAFRKIIAGLYATDNLTDLTVKRVRASAEKQCGLPPGYLRNESGWKDRSKTFIEEEAHRQSAELEAKEAAAKGGAESVVEDDNKENESATAQEQSSPPPESRAQKPAKKRSKKRVIDSDDEESEEESGVKDLASPTKSVPSSDEEPPESPPRKKVKTNRNAAKPARPSKHDTDVDEPKSSPVPPTKASKPRSSSSPPKKRTSITEQEIDTDLSSLDDEPTKKSKPTESISTKPEKSSKPSKPKKATKQEGPDPQTAEIKTLQSNLLKCGVRKLWHRELAPYSTHREKISHLKQMLKDVGMEGRFSAEKAKQIKERRELEADLEAVQEYSQAYGRESKRQGRVSAADALKDLGFDIESGEETD